MEISITLANGRVNGDISQKDAPADGDLATVNNRCPQLHNQD